MHSRNGERLPVNVFGAMVSKNCTCGTFTHFLTTPAPFLQYNSFNELNPCTFDNHLVDEVSEPESSPVSSELASGPVLALLLPAHVQTRLGLTGGWLCALRVLL